MPDPLFDWGALPTEIMISILYALDLPSLLRCKQLSKFLKKIIDEATVLQYKIELAIAGMEDGPCGALGASERLALLRRRQYAWAHFHWTSREEIRMEPRELWHLYGGVLAQVQSQDSVSFVQLPSTLRGIAKKEWDITNIGITIEQFKFDSSQDLLVLIENPSTYRDGRYRVHLRSMATGKPHVATPGPRSTLMHKPVGLDYDWTIEICGDLLAVLFIGDELDNELVLWNWKTGTLKFWLVSSNVTSFAFLTDRHLILSCITYTQDTNDAPIPPSLVAVDISGPHPSPAQLGDLSMQCRFDYPQLDEAVTPFHITIRSDPAPTWSPSPDLAVPFYTSRAERLFVVTFWLADGGNALRSVLLFVPSLALTSHLDSLAQPGALNVLPWEAWATDRTCMMEPPMGHSPTWTSYVFGMSYIAPMWTGNGWGFQILDFNQVGLRHALAVKKGDVPEPIHGETTTAQRTASGSTSVSPPHQCAEALVTRRTRVRAEGRFSRPILTSLPYRHRSVAFSGPPTDNRVAWEGVLLSEDSVIAVGILHANNARIYRTLNL